MNVELSEDEAQYLVEVLEAAHKDLLHELHHVSTGLYKDRLRRIVELNEALTARLKQETAR